jgi:hypothetical protein
MRSTTPGPISPAAIIGSEQMINFVGKTMRIYTVSGVESNLGILEEFKDSSLLLKKCGEIPL